MTEPRNKTEVRNLQLTITELEVLISLIAIGLGRMSGDHTTEFTGVLSLAVIPGAPKIAEEISNKVMFEIDPERLQKCKEETAVEEAAAGRPLS